LVKEFWWHKPKDGEVWGALTSPSKKLHEIPLPQASFSRLLP